ncbi:MAG: hypothetical protein RLY75_1266 [Pseudomonadota bacterium]|jgi:hypothetical protein
MGVPSVKSNNPSLPTAAWIHYLQTPANIIKLLNLESVDTVIPVVAYKNFNLLS